jgi:Sec-independent protein translocase protein TatA
LRSAAGSMGEQLMEAGTQAGERLSEVAEERGLTAEGLKQAARDVGETFSSALSKEQSSTQSRTQAGKEAESTTQRRQGQPGTGSTQANKSSGPTRSSGFTPSGGGR